MVARRSSTTPPRQCRSRSCPTGSPPYAPDAVSHGLVGLAFAAGLVAALNPCGFAMLPAYLPLVVRASSDVGAAVAVSRAVAATAAMTLGFLSVFGTFGFLTVSLASTVQQYM